MDKGESSANNITTSDGRKWSKRTKNSENSKIRQGSEDRKRNPDGATKSAKTESRENDE